MKKKNILLYHKFYIFFIISTIALIFFFTESFAYNNKILLELEKLVGNTDSVYIVDAKENIVFSKNINKKLVPASILKVLTSLVAMHYLGSDYVFSTEFYLDLQSNLKIKGYGDPLFISEIISDVSKKLSTKIIKYNDLILDDTYFDKSININGRFFSDQPYDAPIGSLCVNFNTINYKKDNNGLLVSAEKQTPLLPYAKKTIRKYLKKNSDDNGRVVFSHNENENIIYAGKLMKYFFDKQKIISDGNIRLGKVIKKDELIYKHNSKFTLDQIIKKLLKYSNNFIANQLLIATGANVFGPPGNIDKGIYALDLYIKNILNIDDVNIVEGSGLSRKNKVSAKKMHAILNAFTPYYHLMRENKINNKTSDFYKTGTLRDVNSRVGFLINSNGKLYKYVVIINTPKKSTKKIMKKIYKLIN